MIRRLAAAGVPKPEIAAAVGLNLRSVQRLAAGERQDVAERPINTTTAAQELQAKQAEVEALRRLAEEIPSPCPPSAVPLHTGLHRPSPSRQHRYPPEAKHALLGHPGGFCGHVARSAHIGLTGDAEGKL